MRRGSIVATLACLVLAHGCGAGDDSTPAACLAPSATYLRALEAAPGEVRLADGTAISSCLVENQKAGELTRLGIVLVRAATDLNELARQEPGEEAAVQLGYLVGAVETGADDTSGIHSELARRIEAAATFSPGARPLPAPVEAAYERGLDAGRREG